jgi:hypothetical protein
MLEVLGNEVLAEAHIHCPYLHGKFDEQLSIVLPDCFAFVGGNIFLILNSKADSDDEGAMLSHSYKSGEPGFRCLESGAKIEWLFGR